MRSTREWIELTLLPVLVLVLTVAGISLGLAAAAGSTGLAVGPWFVTGVAVALTGVVVALAPTASGGKHKR
jgi:hypothetical protein